MGPILKGPICCPETSVTEYQCTLRNIPEERISHLHESVSLKSRKSNTYSQISVVEFSFFFK